MDNRKRRYENRVYQYATGRGGVPLGNSSRRIRDDEDFYEQNENRVYQYAGGRGGIPLSRQDIDRYRRETSLVEGPHFGKGPKGWKRSDERIKEEVCEALYHSRDVDASNIEVEVKDGCVYLKGEVDSRDTKRLAEDTVENVAGVRDVQNALMFRKDEPMIRHSDSEPQDEMGTRLS